MGNRAAGAQFCRARAGGHHESADGAGDPAAPGDRAAAGGRAAARPARRGAMKTLTRPVWWEGMYLGPHHFQAQNRYFEDALNFVTESLWRDASGFAGLQFDSDALRNGTLVLTHARGLFE